MKGKYKNLNMPDDNFNLNINLKEVCNCNIFIV